jgi:hypothetical protein
MKYKYITYLFLLATLIYTCSSESEENLEARALAEILDQEDPEPEPEDESEDENENEDDENENNENEINSITFESDVRTIMENNCNRCHTSPPAFGAPFPLLDFDQVSSRIDRIIIRMNSASNPMPPSGRVSFSIRNTMEQWREDGLLEE